MRLAFASPFPPLRSGIADYVVDLVARLAAGGIEPVLFFEGREPPPEELARAFPCRPVGELASRRGEFDLVLYQLGNSAPHHAGIYRALVEVPGVVELHEFMLHHLVRELTLGARRADDYVEEMRYAAGESGRRAARRLLDTHHPVDVWSFPLFERAVDRSLAVVVHSEFARQRILRSRPGARVAVVPFAAELGRVEPVDAAGRLAARERLGWGPRELVVGSFGFVTPHKHLEPALAAFAELSRRRSPGDPSARFVICGELSPHYDLASRIAELGGEGIELLGRLDAELFDAAMRACDIAVNLRHPTGGETSAALVRLLAHGVPTIVSDTGWFAEIPDGAVAKVPFDGFEERHLAALLERLAGDPELRRAIGRSGRRHVERAHAPGAAAKALARELESVLADPPAVEPAVPPLSRWDGRDPALRLAASIGADWADLGLAPEDPGLGALAGTLAELGWAPGRDEPG